MSDTANSSSRVNSVILSGAADVLLALSSTRRLAVLNAIAGMNAASGPVSLSDVGQKLDVNMKDLSKEVVRLTEAGLVRRDNGALTAQVSRLGELADSVAELTSLCQAIPPTAPLRRAL